MIYISEYLGKTNAGKGIAEFFKDCLTTKYDIKVIEIPLNKNEWCRDYMPVKNAKGELIQFTYNPSYLRAYPTYRKTIPEDQKAINEHLGLTIKQYSNIILDGGAVEIIEERALLSDRVLSENTASWTGIQPELPGKVQNLLEIKDLIVIPADPWDFTGHIDGLVRFITPGKVLINDMSGLDQVMQKENKKVRMIYEKWKESFFVTLSNNLLKPVTLPCTVHRNDQNESAVGVYMNFLKLKQCIVMPVFNDKEIDQAAKDVLEREFDLPVEEVEANKLAEKGGIINCVTWNI